ncbi:Spondin-1 [Halocaridina rubra]|uniref:Spondin-1 n=1 Tax=Halocaridina rubra TaxID=373956 RepID=A0AAN9FWX2_HALRR
MDDGELSKELCEEVQENEDMQPPIIYDCCACDEAKYEVTFEGMWSRQTHPKDFPTNEWLTHFSDIIGASHSADYRVWEYGGYSSDGLRQVAEWGSTRTLESELKRQSDHIRTIIKARGLWYPLVNGKTFAVFRVDNRHHLMSLVSMLGPSPDWIVGVSALELCLRNCSWVDQKTLNLYPWDAGTDSGITYDSANAPTIPREKIRRITNSYPNDPKSPFHDPTGPMKPLARLTITRQRVYEKSCADTSPLGFDETYIEEEEDAARPECEVGSWTHWTQCSVTCGKGLRMRSRIYIMPMKAQMSGCHRQMEEKEMCAAAEPYCPEGSHFDRDPLEYFPEDFNPRLCDMTEWSSWTPCSVTCGKGHRMRNRRYLDRMGRKRCQKDTTQKEMCMAEVPECEDPPEEEEISAECAVTQWTEWSPCSVTCGEGVTTRTRYFLIPVVSIADCNIRTMDKNTCHGVRKNCTIDPSEREEVCMQEREMGPCRGRFRRWYFDTISQSCKEFSYGGCRGNRNNFESYDECQLMCAMNKPPVPEHLYQPNTPNVVNFHHSANGYGNGNSHLPDPIDCMVTPWSEWGPCSVSCGKGRKEKMREIKVHAANGGKRCPKKLKRTRKCTMPKCNNGYSGLQSMSLHREEPVPYESADHSQEYLSPHYEPYEYIAPALFNPPPLDTQPGVQHIYLHKPANEEQIDDGTKADCVMGEWGPWSPCTHSCGNEALQQRSRTIIVSPRNGGSPCGDRYERRYCTLPPCPQTRG